MDFKALTNKELIDRYIKVFAGTAPREEQEAISEELKARELTPDNSTDDLLSALHDNMKDIVAHVLVKSIEPFWEIRAKMMPDGKMTVEAAFTPENLPDGAPEPHLRKLMKLVEAAAVEVINNDPHMADVTIGGQPAEAWPDEFDPLNVEGFLYRRDKGEVH